MPANFHYTGPFHDVRVRPPAPFPWERLTGRPLIYASMGTLQNRLDTYSRRSPRPAAGWMRTW